MRRTYRSRGKDRSIEEVEDVRAVRMTAAVREDMRPFLLTNGWADEIVTDVGSRGDSMIREDQLSAFEQNGWLFIKPSVRIQTAAQRDELPGQIAEARPVYRHDSGRVVVGSSRITVKFAPELSIEEAEKQLQTRGLKPLRRLRFAPNLFVAEVPVGQDMLTACEQLRDACEYAEPVFIEHLPHRSSVIDPEYEKQWQWGKIDSETAWANTKGGGARIAVIDNGFDVNHEDLVDGVSGDSGYFVADPARPADEEFRRSLDNYPTGGGHGTFCAGMAAARKGNPYGGCGSAPEADIMLVACLEDQLSTQVTLARAVAYAADPTTEIDGASPDAGADVISCSLGPNDAEWEIESVLEEAINFAVNFGRAGSGTPVFWAVSNGFHKPTSGDEVASLANTIAVARSTSDDEDGHASRGPEIDFVAPGVGVHSTMNFNQYGIKTGTSFAAPCASGVAALILSLRPELSWDEVRQIMRDTCDPIGSEPYIGGRNPVFGFGRVNAARAVTEAISASGTTHQRVSFEWLYSLLLS